MISYSETIILERIVEPALRLGTSITIEGKQGIFYQVFLMGKSSSVFFTASTTEDIEMYKDMFVRTGNTIRIK